LLSHLYLKEREFSNWNREKLSP